MHEKGFSLIELIVTMALIATMLGIAVQNWREMNIKSGVESQMKKMHADLMEIRLQALYGKSARSVIISGAQFRIYSSETAAVSPIETVFLKYPVNTNNTKLTFDSSGLAIDPRSICVSALYPWPTVDSLVVSRARINLGKRTGSCTSDDITQR